MRRARRGLFVRLSLAWPDGHVESFEGKVEGTSGLAHARQERLSAMTRYFLPAGGDMTFGEMDPAAKHAISHRADAFAQLVAACFVGLDWREYRACRFASDAYAAAWAFICTGRFVRRFVPIAILTCMRAHKNNADDKQDWLVAYRAELTHAHGLRPRRAGRERVFRRWHTLAHAASIWSAGILQTILTQSMGAWRRQAEISLEANPMSAAAQSHLQKLRHAGVTRLSLGVQAFDDKALKFLGRTHSASRCTQHAYVDAARAIFDSTSFDLIYARPDAIC